MRYFIQVILKLVLQEVLYLMTSGIGCLYIRYILSICLLICKGFKEKKPLSDEEEKKQKTTLDKAENRSTRLDVIIKDLQQKIDKDIFNQLISLQ